MNIHNYMEDIAAEILEDLLVDKTDVCTCEKCRADILALALNKLPARYVVTSKGRVYTKLSELQLQFRADIVRELAKAMDFVSRKPQH